MPERRLNVVVTGDTRGLERAFGRTSATAKVFGANVEKAGVQADRSVRAFRNLGAVFAGGFVASAVLDQLKVSVSAASNLAEQTSKAQQVFGSFSGEVEAFARTSARSYGIASDAALQLAGSYGALFRPLGITAREAAKQSVALTKLGADLASFYNTDVADALQAIQSGLVGQVEPLRRYGVELSAARVQAQALQDTGKDAVAELTNQEKVLARIKLIFRDTAIAQGDFARTSGGLANQQRILAAEIRDLQSSIGKVLIPTVTEVVKGFNDAITAADALGDGLKRLGGAISENDPTFSFLGRFGGVAKDIVKFANPITGSFERTRKALELLGVEFDKSGDKAAGFSEAFEKLVTFQAPAVQQGNRSNRPPVFGQPGFRPAGVTLTTELPTSQQIRLADAERSGSLQAQLAALNEQRRTLEEAVRQVGLTPAETLSLKNDLNGVVSSIRAINEQIAADAKANSQALRDARLAIARRTPGLGDDLRELVSQRRQLQRQLNAGGLSATDRADLEQQLTGVVSEIRSVNDQIASAAKEWREKLKQAGQQLRDARIERLDLVQSAREVARALRDAQERLELARQIGGSRGIREAREGLQDAQTSRQRLRLQGVTFRPSTAATGSVQNFGNVNIKIDGAQDPVKTAQAVMAEIRKQSRRSSPQQRGRQPGERLGGV